MDVNENETNLQPENSVGEKAKASSLEVVAQETAQETAQATTQAEALQEKSQEHFFQDAPTQAKLTEAPFNFSESDVDKNGNLKAVRGRVLKKLLKYEFKALFTGMLSLVLSAVVCSILLAIQIPILESQDAPTMYGTNETPWFFWLTVVLAILLNGGVMIGSLILPSQRYRKNFFKEEGYLTFSIPATAHEQILAKHISAVLCYVAGWLANMFSLIVIIIGFGGFEAVFGPINPSTDPVQTAEVIEGIICILELLIMALMLPVFIATFDGAAAWWEERLPEKNRRIYQMLITLALISLLETLFITSATSGLITAFFELPITLVFFIFIFIGALLIYLFYTSEINNFKKNINLK